MDEYANSAYKNATLTYDYTDYDTWEVPSETDSSLNGFVYYNGAWFAVSGGTINWSTTLVEYNGMWFYVSGSMVDWDYTGTYEFYGNTFNIVGGVVASIFYCMLVCRNTFNIVGGVVVW